MKFSNGNTIIYYPNLVWSILKSSIWLYSPLYSLYAVHEMNACKGDYVCLHAITPKSPDGFQ